MSATSEYSSLLGTDRLIDPILRSSTVSLSASSDGNTPYRVYTRRWFMLTVVCVLNISNAMIWMTFGPIADRAGEYFKISYNEVNWLSLIFMTASIPLGICASWLLDTMGLRASIVLGSWLNAIGCGVRVISTLSFVPQQARFPVLISGQFLAACSQPFVMFSPTKLAATWFQGDQRATANMIASVSNPVGILLANILSPLLAPNQHDVPFA
ncbi:solute carrier family 49 member A3-like, partial [Saccoglossus kowalevskii]